MICFYFLPLSPCLCCPFIDDLSSICFRSVFTTCYARVPKERNQPRKFYIPPLFNVVPNQLNLTVVPNFCYYHLLVRLVLVQLLCIF